MKKLRLILFIAVTAFACSLPVQAQQWTYTGNQGTTQAYINITRQSTGWAVSGAITYDGRVYCSIRGTYYPQTGQIRGTCTSPHGSVVNLNGVQRGNGFQLSGPMTIVVTNVGGAPPAQTQTRPQTQTQAVTSQMGECADIFPQLAGKRLVKKEKHMVHEYWWSPGSGRRGPAQYKAIPLYIWYVQGGGSYRNLAAYECERQKLKRAGWEFQMSKGSTFISSQNY